MLISDSVIFLIFLHEVLNSAQLQDINDRVTNQTQVEDAALPILLVNNKHNTLSHSLELFKPLECHWSDLDQATVKIKCALNFDALQVHLHKKLVQGSLEFSSHTGHMGAGQEASPC